MGLGVLLMKIFFILSGEHKTLPKSEVLATLETTGTKFRIVASFDQVLVVDTYCEPDTETETVSGICKRLALSHEIAEFYGFCDSEKEKILSLAETSFTSPKRGLKGTFCVRIKRVKEYGKDGYVPAFSLKCTELERDIGQIIKNKTGAEVDLSLPEETIIGVITNKFVLGKRICKIDRSNYEKRRPQKRPYFHPGTMLPRTCRALVNLTRIKPGEKLADPFCGTGGFLIEAGLVGAKVYGFDIEEEFIDGCRKNLEHYGIKDSVLRVADARYLDYNEYFDAVIGDLPYGISSSTKGLSREKLYMDSLKSFYRMLKPGRYACIIGPIEIDTEKMAEETGFKITEKHTERIHRSLTRKIVVIKKHE